MVKRFLFAAIIAVFPAICVQSYADENDSNESENVVWTQDGFQSAHHAMSAMNERSGLRYDVVYRQNGSIEDVSTRGGFYLSPRVGFEYNYLFGSKTNYPAIVGELGLGYRTKRLDARFYAGVASARIGNYSDKGGKYISPRLSIELLGEVAHDHQFEENLFKIGVAINYHLRRANVVGEGYAFDFVGSYPGAALLMEYERQFWGSRSSLTLGVYVGNDYEPGLNKQALGIAGGVYFSYRIGVQKKNIYNSSDME